MKTVRVKVETSGAVKTMNEDAANRLVKVNPKEYKILEPPKVEVLNLPPLTEKKSVAVADVEPAKQVITADDEPRKPGRPKKV